MGIILLGNRGTDRIFFQVLHRPKNMCVCACVCKCVYVWHNHSFHLLVKPAETFLLKVKSSSSCQENILHLFLTQVVETWVVLKHNSNLCVGKSSSFCQNMWYIASTAGYLNCHSEFLSYLQTVWKYERENCKQFIKFTKLF